MDVAYYSELEHEKWIIALGRDNASRLTGKIRLVADLGGSAVGLPNVKYLGNRLFEVRVDKYRVYFEQDDVRMLILTSGEKDTQTRDIARARRRMA